MHESDCCWSTFSTICVCIPHFLNIVISKKGKCNPLVFILKISSSHPLPFSFSSSSSIPFDDSLVVSSLPDCWTLSHKLSPDEFLAELGFFLSGSLDYVKLANTLILILINGKVSLLLSSPYLPEIYQVLNIFSLENT